MIAAIWSDCTTYLAMQMLNARNVNMTSIRFIALKKTKTVNGAYFSTVGSLQQVDCRIDLTGVMY